MIQRYKFNRAEITKKIEESGQQLFYIAIDADVSTSSMTKAMRGEPMTARIAFKIGRALGITPIRLEENYNEKVCYNGADGDEGRQS